MPINQSMAVKMPKDCILQLADDSKKFRPAEVVPARRNSFWYSRGIKEDVFIFQCLRIQTKVKGGNAHNFWSKKEEMN